MTNVVGSVFSVPLGYTALAISALFGLLVLAAAVPLWQRAVYYVLNTLIIFCVAMGSNVTAQKISDSGQAGAPSSQAGASLFVSAAYAQDSSDLTKQDVIKGLNTITSDPSLNADEKLQAIQEELDSAKAAGVSPQSDTRSQGFFKSWDF